MNRLRVLRKERGMTQEDLAQHLNVRRSVISKYETDTVQLTSDTISVLVDLFGVSADYLLGRTDDPTPPGEMHRIFDDETLEIAEYMHKRPIAKALFRASKHASTQALEAIMNLLDHMTSEGDGDNYD